jgi:hypothetical protein
MLTGATGIHDAVLLDSAIHRHIVALTNGQSGVNTDAACFTYHTLVILCVQRPNNT